MSASNQVGLRQYSWSAVGIVVMMAGTAIITLSGLGDRTGIIPGVGDQPDWGLKLWRVDVRAECGVDHRPETAAEGGVSFARLVAVSGCVGCRAEP